MNRRYRAAMDNLVVELVDGRMTTMQIARALGVSRDTICRVRARQGITGPMARPSIDEERVVVLTHRGWSAAKIAAEMDIHPRSVVRARSRTGIAKPYPARHRLTAEQIVTAEALFDDGASRAEVARTIGCARETLERRWPDRAWTREQVLELMWASQRR